MLRLQPRNHFGFDRLAGIRLNIKNLTAIAHLSKRNRQTITPSATGTANAVGVVFGFHRQTKVKNVGDGWNVDTTRGHICRHQNLNLSLAQGHQTPVAQTLAQCAVQCNGVKAILLQVIGQAIAFNLGTGKDNRLVNTGIAQPVV